MNYINTIHLHTLAILDQQAWIHQKDVQKELSKALNRLRRQEDPSAIQVTQINIQALRGLLEESADTVIYGAVDPFNLFKDLLETKKLSMREYYVQITANYAGDETVFEDEIEGYFEHMDNDHIALYFADGLQQYGLTDVTTILDMVMNSTDELDTVTEAQQFAHFIIDTCDMAGCKDFKATITQALLSTPIAQLACKLTQNRLN